MNANYPACLAFTLRFEGGKVDDPRDPGGRTNRGVTQRTFSAWLAARGEPWRDVFALAEPELQAIYRSGFWAPVGGDTLPEGVDLAVFDFGVNSGPARALKTLGMQGAGDPAATVRRLCAARLAFLHALRTFASFGRGWTARVAACEALGVKMAEHARIGVPADAPTAPQVASTLHAHGAAAQGAAHRNTTAAGAVVAAGGAVVPAAIAWHPPWLAMGLGLLAVAIVAGLMLRRAHQARLRAQAYAAAAAA